MLRQALVRTADGASEHGVDTLSRCLSVQGLSLDEDKRRRTTMASVSGLKPRQNPFIEVGTYVFWISFLMNDPDPTWNVLV